MSLSERLEQAKANLQPSTIKVIMFTYENDRFLVGIRPQAENLEFTVGLVQQSIPNLANVHPRDISFYATIPELEQEAQITETAWQPLAPTLDKITVKVISRPQSYRPTQGYAEHTTPFASRFTKANNYDYSWQVTVTRPSSTAGGD